MVAVVFPKSWLSAILHRRRKSPSDDDPKLEILAFEAAKAMSRLVSLHRALSEPQLLHLRSHTARSFGVTHLVSSDHPRLLRLACAEFALDLDSAADAVSRLAFRSPHTWPRAFHHVYSDLKSASTDFDHKLGFSLPDIEKKMHKMERYAAGIAALHSEMETLAEMEASERKLQRWKSYSGPLTTPSPPPQQNNPRGAELFMKKLAAQRRLVRRLQDESLWGETVGKTAELMARAVITVFGRMCTVFAVVVPELPRVSPDGRGRFRVLGPSYPRIHPNYASGPLERPAMRSSTTKMVMNSGPIYGTKKQNSDEKLWAVMEMEASAGTVGEAGLELRYGDVISMAERMLYAPDMVSEEARRELYAMLPGELRAAVMARKGEVDGSEAAAGRGREAARKVLAWLGPMAEDTVRWHAERSCERQKLDGSPRVLAMQTLRFAERRRTEAAIVEVLVGLSCVLKYLNGKRREEEEEDDDDATLILRR